MFHGRIFGIEKGHTPSYFIEVNKDHDQNARVRKLSYFPSTQQRSRRKIYIYKNTSKERLCVRVCVSIQSLFRLLFSLFFVFLLLLYYFFF